MASIQEVATAAARIAQSAASAEAKTMACADALKTQASQLAATIHGSRSGEDAVRQVNQAERALRDSAAQLLKLQSEIDRFIQDLTK